MSITCIILREMVEKFISLVYVCVLSCFVFSPCYYEIEIRKESTHMQGVIEENSVLSRAKLLDNL